MKLASILFKQNIFTNTQDRLSAVHYIRRGVMVKAFGLWNRSKRVQTPLVLLRSLSDIYPWVRYEPPYPPSYGLNNTTTLLLKG